MARLCLDCGIPPWRDCVCDGDAGLDHPHVPNIYKELAPDLLQGRNEGGDDLGCDPPSAPEVRRSDREAA